jgi:hypothetical protein
MLTGAVELCDNSPTVLSIRELLTLDAKALQLLFHGFQNILIIELFILLLLQQNTQ